MAQDINCPFLCDELCRDQLDEMGSKILEEYGISHPNNSSIMLQKAKGIC
jgi:hypothetical protein